MWKQCYFKHIFTIELFIAFKMAHSCCFSLGGNLDFPEFLQKKFYNINYRPKKLYDNFLEKKNNWITIHLKGATM